MIVDQNHQCFMKVKTYKPKVKGTIYFDLECRFNKDQIHIVNYAVAYDTNLDKYFHFSGLDAFFDWIAHIDHDDYTFIAHNGASYDFQFVLQYLIRRLHQPPKTFIVNGSKIVTMVIKIRDISIRFIDSCSFIARPLA